MKKYLVFFSLLFTLSCGDDAFLKSATEPLNPNEIISGDIIVISGDSTGGTTAPYPTHQINLYSASGVHKRTLYTAQAPSLLWGGDLAADGRSLFFTVDNQDRIEQFNFSTFTSSTYFANANVAGTTLRALVRLSDGSLIVAEDRDTVEKIDNTGARDTSGNYPFNPGSTDINEMVRLSGDRFAVSFLGSNDRVRVFDNAGNLVGTLDAPTNCGTNCDPSGILELSDGRIVISTMNNTYERLYIYNSDYTLIGILYDEPSVIRDISTIAQLRNGNIIACSQYQHTCEELEISGDTATRVGTTPLINDVNRIRVPSKVIVVP